MKLELNAKVKGRGTLSTYRKNEVGEIVDKKEVGYIKNLITDGGLRGGIFSFEWWHNFEPSTARYIYLGSDGSAPSFSDTGVKSSLNMPQSAYPSRTLGAERLGDNHQKVWATFTATFSPKGSPYNVSEIAYGSHTRSLIYDSLGEAVTISVKGDEYLAIEYTIQITYQFPKTLNVVFTGHPTITGTKTASLWLRNIADMLGGTSYYSTGGIILRMSTYAETGDIPDYLDSGYGHKGVWSGTMLPFIERTSSGGLYKAKFILPPPSSDAVIRSFHVQSPKTSGSSQGYIKCLQITFDEDITIPANHEFTFELAIKYESV